MMVRKWKFTIATTMGLLLGPIASTGYGESAGPAIDHTARIGFNSVSIQGPGLDRTSRSGLSLEYLYPLREGLRLGALFHSASDDEIKTQRLNVAENFTWIAPSLELSFPLLFRYAIQIAPTYVLSSTEVDFDGTKESLSKTQFGLLVIGRIQYSFHPTIETGLIGGYHVRLNDDKSDWLFGLEIGINISAFGRESGGGASSGDSGGQSSPRKRRG